MKKRLFSFVVDEKTDKKLKEVAKDGRTMSWHLRKAIEQYKPKD